VSTFSTAEEPDFTLIRSAELAEPPDGKVVAAFWAFDLDRGHRLEVFLLIIDNGNLVFAPLTCACHRVFFRALNLPDIAAFTALELTT
jgi:hypothetical protein